MVISNEDRIRVTEILANAFKDNKSVNYIVKQDRKRLSRIKLLMEYAYFMCNTYGRVILSEDKNACALVLFPDKKSVTLKGIYWDVKLVFKVIGLSNLPKVLKREALIKKQHPQLPFYYLWFIGVDPLAAGRGLGSVLLQELTNEAEVMGLPFYLETSTVENIPWYQKFGLHVYHTQDIGYTLYFLKYLT
ncbi:GNAT family N-acetyltransferase [Pedobacter ginsengisoli]|uniref:GNAT family N-acetyltransferase n=1 Tax=Pedobacter ginsengisoli TaxID=363852 RepID=A0A2D1U717_9SPHI|nr:GNAT family N-acetyltransferase [Pedobacter ginsengisoli]ATP57396.1 GNAT family N-acetyltransferase [Pedobacter ginsengisoli]